MMQKYERISLTLPAELLKRFDTWALQHYASRSSAIRQALLDYLETNRAPAAQPEEPAAEPPPTAWEQLSNEQRQLVASYNQGYETWRRLHEAGITPEIQIQLVSEGRL